MVRRGIRARLPSSHTSTGVHDQDMGPAGDCQSYEYMFDWDFETPHTYQDLMNAHKPKTQEQIHDDHAWLEQHHPSHFITWADVKRVPKQNTEDSHAHGEYASASMSTAKIHDHIVAARTQGQGNGSKRCRARRAQTRAVDMAGTRILTSRESATAADHAALQAKERKNTKENMKQRLEEFRKQKSVDIRGRQSYAPSSPTAPGKVRSSVSKNGMCKASTQRRTREGGKTKGDRAGVDSAVQETNRNVRSTAVATIDSGGVARTQDEFVKDIRLRKRRGACGIDDIAEQVTTSTSAPVRTILAPTRTNAGNVARPRNTNDASRGRAVKRKAAEAVAPNVAYSTSTGSRKSRVHSVPRDSTTSLGDIEERLRVTLARHNQGVSKGKHTYEPTKFSVRDYRKWEAQSGKKYRELSVDARIEANKTIEAMLQQSVKHRHR